MIQFHFGCFRRFYQYFEALNHLKKFCCWFENKRTKKNESVFHKTIPSELTVMHFYLKFLVFLAFLNISGLSVAGECFLVFCNHFFPQILSEKISISFQKLEKKWI